MTKPDITPEYFQSIAPKESNSFFYKTYIRIQKTGFNQHDTNCLLDGIVVNKLSTMKAIEFVLSKVGENSIEPLQMSYLDPTTKNRVGLREIFSNTYFGQLLFAALLTRKDWEYSKGHCYKYGWGPFMPFLLNWYQEQSKSLKNKGRVFAKNVEELNERQCYAAALKNEDTILLGGRVYTIKDNRYYNAMVMMPKIMRFHIERSNFGFDDIYDYDIVSAIATLTAQHALKFNPSLNQKKTIEYSINKKPFIDLLVNKYGLTSQHAKKVYTGIFNGAKVGYKKLDLDFHTAMLLKNNPIIIALQNEFDLRHETFVANNAYDKKGSPSEQHSALYFALERKTMAVVLMRLEQIKEKYGLVHDGFYCQTSDLASMLERDIKELIGFDVKIKEEKVAPNAFDDVKGLGVLPLVAATPKEIKKGEESYSSANFSIHYDVESTIATQKHNISQTPILKENVGCAQSAKPTNNLDWIITWKPRQSVKAAKIKEKIETAEKKERQMKAIARSKRNKRK